jgi:biopolymer transport protein ExbB/TolQ
MTFLVDGLYLFSTVLLVPVVVGLFLLGTHSLLALGGALREWQERRSVRHRWQTHQRDLAAGRARLDDSASSAALYPGLVGVYVRRALADGGLPPFIEKHSHTIEIESAARLAGLSFLIRIGPMLGLMGTLIPLGPALIRLTEADMAGMASDLVVAFCTTVLGLLIGGVAYAVWLARRQWYAQDLADIEFLIRILTSGSMGVSVSMGESRGTIRRAESEGTP